MRCTENGWSAVVFCWVLSLSSLLISLLIIVLQLSFAVSTKKRWTKILDICENFELSICSLKKLQRTVLNQKEQTQPLLQTNWIINKVGLKVTFVSDKPPTLHSYFDSWLSLNNIVIVITIEYNHVLISMSSLQSVSNPAVVYSLYPIA